MTDYSNRKIADYLKLSSDVIEYKRLIEIATKLANVKIKGL